MRRAIFLSALLTGSIFVFQSFLSISKTSHRKVAQASVSELSLSGSRAVIIKNGMGMRFVPLPGMDVAMAVHEVTREQFLLFADAVSLAPAPEFVSLGRRGSWRNLRTTEGLTQKGDHPVVNVSWKEATQFCDWLSQNEAKSHRLPTDFEWSVAVGLTTESEYSTPYDRSKVAIASYYWGSSWPPQKPTANFADQALRFRAGSPDLFSFNDGYPGTAPVGSFSPNALGLYDLEGNVGEWVYDWYRGEDKLKTQRGASYRSAALDKTRFLKGYREVGEADFRSDSVGFRIVVETGQSTGTPSELEAAEVYQPVSGGALVFDPSTSSAKIRPGKVEPIEPVAAIPVVVAETSGMIKRARVITTKGRESEKPRKKLSFLKWDTEGVRLSPDWSASQGSREGLLFAQSVVPIRQVGAEIQDGEVIWVEVEVEGWLPTVDDNRTYMTKAEGRQWRSAWNQQDGAITMRSGTDQWDTLLAKVFYNTKVTELDAKTVGSKHYIKARMSGWVMKEDSRKGYFTDKW